MKKLILGLLLTLNCSFAQMGSIYFATNNLAASNHFLLTGGKYVESLTFTTTNTTGSTLVYLYDGAITNVTGAWTNYVTYTTNVVDTYISILGTTNIMTNTVVWNAASTHAAATNNTSPSFVIAVNPATLGPTTYRFTTPLPFLSRVTLSNSLAGLNAVISYHTP